MPIRAHYRRLRALCADRRTRGLSGGLISARYTTFTASYGGQILGARALLRSKRRAAARRVLFLLADLSVSAPLVAAENADGANRIVQILEPVPFSMIFQRKRNNERALQDRTNLALGLRDQASSCARFFSILLSSVGKRRIV